MMERRGADHTEWTLGDLARVSLCVSIAASLAFSLAALARHGFDVGLLCLLATAALMAASLPVLLLPHDSIVAPVWYVVLGVAIGVTGKVFFVLWGPAPRVEFLMLGMEPGDLLPAALVTGVGMLLLSLGYIAGDVRWRIPLPRRLVADDWSGRRVATVAVVFTLIALVSFALFSRQVTTRATGLSAWSFKRFVRVPGSEYPGAGGYLRWGASLIEPAFYALFAFWAARRGRREMLMTAGVVLLALLAILFPVFANSRREIVFLMFHVVVIWTLIRGELRASTSLVLAGATTLLAGVMLALRRAPQLGSVRSGLGIEAVADATFGGHHFLDLTKTAHIMNAFPARFDYHYGETFLRWLIAPVPRSLWPAKPAIGIGKELGPPIFEVGRATGVPPGIIGELHLNFGLMGVLVGTLVFGAVLRSLYVSLAEGFPNKSYVLVYAILVTHVAFGVVTMDFSGTMAKLLQDLIAMLVVIWLCAGPQPAK
jgi:oligosaccharide repeat unit polymerase